jgi:hypothetical protein
MNLTPHQEEQAVSTLFVVVCLLTIGLAVYTLTVVTEWFYTCFKEIYDEMQSL